MSSMLYGISLVLLGAPATILIIIVAHVLEYTWGAHYPWYIQWSIFSVSGYPPAPQGRDHE